MKVVAFTLFSNGVAGAEKRVVKLSLSSWFKNKAFQSLLIINEELYQEVLADLELIELVNKNRERIIIIKNFNSKSKIRVISELYLIKIRYKINFFHCYLGARNLSLPLVLIGVKIVYEVTSPDVALSFVGNYGRRQHFLKKVYRIHCVSYSVYSLLKREMNNQFKNHELNLVYSSLPYTQVNLDGEINYDSKENTIIYAARFIPRKNVLLFASIAKEILREFPEWKIKIFGKGSLQSVIEKELSEEIEEGKASIGYTKNIINELKNSKIVCSFIDPDNFPSQTLFEAMATGNALIVSDTGLSELFVRGNNGILSKRNNHLNDIRELVLDEKRRIQMQKNSVAYFHSSFNENKYFTALIKNCYT